MIYKTAPIYKFKKYHSTWHPADEKQFIREMNIHGDRLVCLSGYINSIHKRENWGPYITKNDVEDFRNEAIKLLKVAMQAERNK